MFATYEIIKSSTSTKIIMDYVSSKGEIMGGESFAVRSPKADFQALAYNYASVRASNHGVTLQAVRPA
jgi:predicted short-subunit dehydrogenase-like oxidoreductase (DUF2520 family)